MGPKPVQANDSTVHRRLTRSHHSILYWIPDLFAAVDARLDPVMLYSMSMESSPKIITVRYLPQYHFLTQASLLWLILMFLPRTPSMLWTRALLPRAMFLPRTPFMFLPRTLSMIRVRALLPRSTFLPRPPFVCFPRTPDDPNGSHTGVDEDDRLAQGILPLSLCTTTIENGDCILRLETKC